MKTILTVLDIELHPAILSAHIALGGLKSRFEYHLLKRKSDRHSILEALSMLELEIEAHDAEVHVDDGRRILLAHALLQARNAIADNAWSSLVADDKAEEDTIVSLVEHFEAARRTITVACFDLKAALA